MVDSTVIVDRSRIIISMKQSEAVQESRVDEKPFVALLALLDATITWLEDRKELQVCDFLRYCISRVLAVSHNAAEPIGISLRVFYQHCSRHASLSQARQRGEKHQNPKSKKDAIFERQWAFQIARV